MRAFSPVDAALEGLRVVRREPMAVAYWVAVWAVVLTLIAVLRLFTGALTPAVGPADEYAAIRRFGPLAILLAPTLLVLWVMTTATVYRAVLRPGEHGWHLLKLGPDEARIAVLSAAETLLLALLGGVPAYLLLVVLNPIFELWPAFNRVIAVVGFLGTVAIDIWLAVRLSLTPVQTFAARGFPFQAYWGLGRGRFWRMLLSYTLVALELLAFLAATVVVAAVFGWLAESAAQWRGGGVVRRAVLWLLVPVGALLIAAGWVVPIILTCGCQAYVYRAVGGATVPTALPAAAPEPETKAEAEPKPARKSGLVGHALIWVVGLLVLLGITRRPRRP
jgi:hypothetical protein